MRMLFVCEENKNKDFIQQFILFRVSLRHAFKRVPQRMHVVLLMHEPDAVPCLQAEEDAC